MHPFAQLFEINRLIANESIFCHLLSSTTDTQSKARKIVYKLNQHGLEKYMKKLYKDDECSDIDSMYWFCMKQFPIEWSNLISISLKTPNKSLTTDKRDNSGSSHQTDENTFSKQFWTCKDIIMKSFQYLDYLSLVNCDNVCSQFLIIAMNGGSFSNHLKLVEEHQFKHLNKMSLGTSTRHWKRFTLCKHLVLDFRKIAKFRELRWGNKVNIGKTVLSMNCTVLPGKIKLSTCTVQL